MAEKNQVKNIIYFRNPGLNNTEGTIRAACRRARELGIKEMVVATETGRTALEVVKRFKLGEVIAVTYHAGAGKPFQDPLPPAARRKLVQREVRIVTCGHALSGAERGISKSGGCAPLDLVANSLRMFGQGTKVCVEIVLMAADAGALSGKDVIALGGSGEGADTALVIAPAHQNRIFDLKIREIICKPRNF